MLILFDLDGTLISAYMDNPDRQYHRWHILSGRRELLAHFESWQYGSEDFFARNEH